MISERGQLTIKKDVNLCQFRGLLPEMESEELRFSQSNNYLFIPSSRVFSFIPLLRVVTVE